MKKYIKPISECIGFMAAEDCMKLGSGVHDNGHGKGDDSDWKHNGKHGDDEDDEYSHKASSGCWNGWS